MAGGVHLTSPVNWSSALVISLTSYLPSALEIQVRAEQPHSPHTLLVVQDNVGQPNPLTGNIESLHAAVIIWIPLQFIVVPFLEKKTSVEAGADDISLKTDLINPDVGGHHLVLQVHIDQLGQLQAQLDCEGLCEVWHGSDQPVVVVEQVVIQSLGVGVALTS